MNPNILLRLVRLVRSPPGPRAVRMALALAVLLGALAAYEHFFGWPDWATVNPRPRALR